MAVLTDREIAALYSEHEDYLRRIASIKVDLYRGSETMIDDCLAAAFESLIIRNRRGTEMDNPIAWLTAAVRWAAWRLCFLDGRVPYRGQMMATATEDIGRNVAVDGLFENALVRELILTGLRGLSPRQREIFMRREIRGDTREEIASDLGISPNTVSFSLYVACNRLAELMEKGTLGRTTEMVKANRPALRADRGKRPPKPRRISESHTMQLAAARAVLAARRKEARSLRAEVLHA